MKKKHSKFRFPYLKALIYFILITIIAIPVYILFKPNYYDVKSPVHFLIEPGASLNKVTDNLYEKGIIVNKAAFKFASIILDVEKNIKPGRYMIPNGLNYFELANLIHKGQPEIAKLITIPEGIWQKDIARIFRLNLGVDSLKFMQLSYDKNFIDELGIEADNLEGYLLPETYYFYTDATEEEIIKKLVNETKRIFNDSLTSRMKELKMNLNQVLTLASIIDGESNLIAEFPKISSVYHNRLRMGMRLQADPTVQYLIRDRKNNNRVLYRDLEINSPYNTYKNTGLPPSPINNPGKDAIKAVLFPEKSNLIYFVADGNGAHKFTSSYSEHTKNVRNYRIVRRKNQ